jgi:3-keto-disaccharide hydrolase
MNPVQKVSREEITMKRRSIVGAALLVAGFAAFPYAHGASGQTDAGWITLFDGKNLDSFNQIGNANWRIEDGLAVADKGNGFLVSKNTYTDYQIRAEFWIDGEANSGVFIRCTDPDKIGANNAYEVNIWDARPDPSYGTGAIVNVGKVDPMPRAAGKWNVYEITAKGSTFTVTLNGQKTVDGAQDAKFASGKVALQHGLGLKDDKGVEKDGGTVKFRKVEIKPL